MASKRGLCNGFGCVLVDWWDGEMVVSPAEAEEGTISPIHGITISLVMLRWRCFPGYDGRPDWLKTRQHVEVVPA